MTNILSVDVEDWFHILELNSSPDLNEWNCLESRVEKNLSALLDVFDKAHVKATCFFLGWVAERFPDLVKDAHRRGHEVASHGYAHQLIYTQTRQEFSDDIKRTKEVLENITGARVLGYRAPGFSLVEDVRWALEELARAGYKYDSSIFPASRGHGGIVGARVSPHGIETEHGTIVEFPITVAEFLGKRMCFFGGGYLRLFPYATIKYMSGRVNRQGRPVIYYVHPREIDPSHPRLAMSVKRRFKSYVNLSTTMRKLRSLLNDERLTTFGGWLAENGGTVTEGECGQQGV